MLLEYIIAVCVLKHYMGFEPMFSAWKAEVLDQTTLIMHIQGTKFSSLLILNIRYIILEVLSI